MALLLDRLPFPKEHQVDGHDTSAGGSVKFRRATLSAGSQAIFTENFISRGNILGKESKSGGLVRIPEWPLLIRRCARVRSEIDLDTR